METFNFSNSNIDLASESVAQFLAKAGVERREALRTKLTFEEVLLEYQDKFGEEAFFKLRLLKRLFSTKLEIIVEGPSYNALVKNDDESDIIQGLLAGIGLAPTWNYKNSKNYIVFTPKKKPLSGTVKLVAAIGLALIVGFCLNILPDSVSVGVNDYLLTPVTNAFMGLISAVSGPLIFLSVLGSICSMGNMETLGKIGSKTVKYILLYMSAIAVLMTAIGCLFYKIETGGGGGSDFSQVLELVYDIIPSNLFEPFITGNALQLIFISVIVGLSMLVLSSRVSGVFGLVEQFGAIIRTIMAALSSLLPILIFVLFTGMISNGNFGAILSSWKMIAVILTMIVVYYVLNLLRLSLVKKISPVLLFSKTWQTLLVALSTASSAAAFASNVQDSKKKLGIDKKFVDFGIPIGQVLFKPGFFALLFGMSIGLAESCDISITVPWLLMAAITNYLITFALPPVPGGGMMGFTIAFTQLGIPMEVMGVALAVNAIIDFPATACNVSAWQLTMVEVADSLDMLDKETLHKK